MCAASLLESGYTDPLFLFDKNPHLGAKVIISWGGRCNLTTSFYKKDQLKPKYPRGWDLIEKSITEFWPKKIMRRFEYHGVPLKTEKDGRVFPVSNKGKDVVGVFEKLFSDYNNFTLCLSERILDIQKTSDGQFLIVSDKNEYRVWQCVITTGGNAYRHTGSTGDGYAFALWLWHTITQLGPSLNSFETSDVWLHELSWISFPNSTITSHDNHQFRWPFLLTHFGISWPVVFAYSAHIARLECEKTKPLKIKRKPESEKGLDIWMKRFGEQKQLHQNKQIDTILKAVLPSRFAGDFLDYADIPGFVPMHELTKTHLLHMSTLLWEGIPLELIARRPGDEFVTAWGVNANEINSATLESKLCPWLYFAGEIMDVDGVTWWYNLTASWAAGKQVASCLLLVIGCRDEQETGNG